MTRHIITHVGTSTLTCEVFNNCPDLDDAQQDWQDWLNVPPAQRPDQPIYDQSSTQKCANYLTKRLESFWKETYPSNTDDDPKYRRNASPAEIASLSLLTVEGTDQVVLLHSDTAEGYMCAWLLKTVLSQNLAPDQGYPCYPIDHIRPVAIGGLRVSGDTIIADSEAPADKHTFVREGLVNYVRAVWDAYRQCQSGDEFIFNITGGYKGMIPIGRDLALLLAAHSRNQQEVVIRSEVCYLYQHSSELIRYGTLPVRFENKPSLYENLQHAQYPDGILRKDLPRPDNLPGCDVFFEMCTPNMTDWIPYVHSIAHNTARLRRSALGEVVVTLYEQQQISATPIR